MEVGVRELRNDTADIVPHGGRTRWLSGAALRDQLGHRRVAQTTGYRVSSTISPVALWRACDERAGDDSVGVTQHADFDHIAIAYPSLRVIRV